MKRLILITALLLTAICAVAVIGLNVIVRSDRFLREARQGLERGIGRRVTFSSVSPGFFPRPGVRVRDFSLYEEDGISRFVTSPDLSISVNILPLLWRQVSIRAISLDRPRVLISRGADGRWNFEKLMRKGEKPPVARGGAPARGGGRFGVSIASLRVRHGEAVVSGPSMAGPLVVSGISLRATGLSPGKSPYIDGCGKIEGAPLKDIMKTAGPIDGVDFKDGVLSGPVKVRGRTGDTLDFSAAIEARRVRIGGASFEGPSSLRAKLKGTRGKMSVDASLDLKGGRISLGKNFIKPPGASASLTVPFRLDGETVSWDGAVAKMGGIKLIGDGSLETGGDGLLSFHIVGEDIDLVELNPFISAGAKLKGRGEIDLLVERGRLSGIATKGEAKIMNGEIAFPNLAGPIRYSALCAFEADRVRIGVSDARLGSSVGEGYVSLDLRNWPSLNFELNFPVIDFADFAASRASALRRFSLVGDADAAETAARPAGLRSFEKLKGDGRITVGELKVGKLKARDGRGKVRLSNGKAILDEINLSLYGGVAGGRFIADLSADDPAYSLSSRLENLDLPGLLSDLHSRAGAITGKLSAECEASGSGRNWAAVHRNIRAAGRFSVRDGALPGFGFMNGLAPFFLLLGQEAKCKEFSALGGLMAKAPAETRFSRCDGGFTMEGDRFATGDMIVEIVDRGAPVRIQLDGEMGAGGELDLKGRACFPRGSEYYVVLSPYFPDDDGWIRMPFPIPIGGTVGNPTVDFEAARSGLVECAAEVAKMRLRKELEKGIEKAIAPKEEPGRKPGAEDAGRELLKEGSKELLRRVLR